MKKTGLSLFAVILLFFCGCASTINNNTADQKVKYVFLFVADGFGENHFKLLKDETGAPALSQFDLVRHTGTLNHEGKITDSAASGTAIACGVKTYNGAIGMTPDRRPVSSIAKEFKAAGFKVGIISTSPINDATPAAHYANAFNRSERSLIIHDLLFSGFDFFGASNFYPDSRYRPTADEYLALIARKYRVTSGTDWSDLDPNDHNFLINQMVRDFPAAPRNSPSLADFTAKAVELLDNPDGFFLMVEEGTTDAYSHLNDAGSLLRSAMDFDKAVAVALEFQKKHPENTLIVVTADHNTGGLYFLENYSPGNTSLLYQSMPWDSLDRMTKDHYREKAPVDLFERDLVDALSLGRITPAERNSIRPYFAHFILKQRKSNKTDDGYSTINPPAENNGKDFHNPLVLGFTRLRDKRNGLAWRGFGHTEEKVLTFAKGPGAEMFDREDLENTSIAILIREIALKNNQPTAVK